MVGLRATLILLAVGAAGMQPAVATEARKQWRPATAADIQRQQARTGQVAAATPSARSGAVEAPALGQQAYIDPLTNELIDKPAGASPALPAAAAGAAPDFVMQRTPEGFLYIDTSTYRHIETMVVDASNSLSSECSVQSPWSESAIDDADEVDAATQRSHQPEPPQ